MKEQLRNLIATTTGLPISSVTDYASLTHDLGLDSLETVELVLHLENHFNVAIPDQDYPQLNTVDSIYQYLLGKNLALA